MKKPSVKASTAKRLSVNVIRTIKMAATRRRAVMEQRELEHRRKEFKREDILKQLSKDAVITGLLVADERVDNIRRLRGQKIREEEERTVQALIQEEKERQFQAEMNKRDEEIMAEIQRIQTERLRNEKLRQSIRENSVELRDLEQKLNYAYMNKERALQITEKQLLLKQEKLMEEERAKDMGKAVRWLVDSEQNKVKEAHERSVNYHKDLAKQLEDVENRKKQEYEQFLKEKAMVDEIVRKIAQEDAAASAKRLEKQEETKKFIEDFVKEQIIWKQKDLERQKKEDESIMLYAQSMQNRDGEIKQKKRDIEAARDKIYAKLAHDMESKEKQKEELEELRIELSQQEMEESARQRDEYLLQQRIKKRLELLDAYQKQVEDKKMLLLRAKEEENIFREKMMQKYAEDDRLEQLTEQRKKLKKIEHKKAIEALIEERRRAIKKEEEEYKIELMRQQELEKYRLDVIEQERQRLLQEHAGKLIGFLPKGVLRDQKDLDLFDEEFKAKFGNLKIDK